MKVHEENALHLAKYLSGHSKIEKVYYPGLENHEKHDIAKKQMTGYGGVSIELKGGLTAVEKFVSKLKLFFLAESLGGFESLVCYPASMSHVTMTQEQRTARGITDSLLRLSIGIENKLDLKDDLEQALA
jgi:cystathionine beta-lyase/cystathionine gamma-synthase